MFLRSHRGFKDGKEHRYFSVEESRRLQSGKVVQHRVEAHILVAFLAYCLMVSLKNRLQAHAPGLTAGAVLEKLATIQMLDVWFPTTDGRWPVMPRYTEPEPDQALLLHKLKLRLPPQPPPRVKSGLVAEPLGLRL